jgi:23S rRNA U2552 (ribose-2'-O)-methylase RlmE/FtsJ
MRIRGIIGALLGLALAAGCGGSSIDRSPERFQRIAADVVDMASQSKYADVELTGMSIEEQYIIVGLADQAPEFVTDVLSRFGSAVGFKIGYQGQPVACFQRDVTARPRGCENG